MRAFKALVVAAIAAAGFIMVYSFASPVQAKPQYKKDTGKACSYCHDGSPKEGKLTPKGECYKKTKDLSKCE